MTKLLSSIHMLQEKYDFSVTDYKNQVTGKKIISIIR